METSSISVLGSARDCVGAWADGEWGFDDVTGPISVGLDLLSAALDPVAALIAAPLADLMMFMVSHIRPVQDALEKLMGSEELVTQQATAWTDVAQMYADAGTAHHGFVTSDLPQWTGEAAEKYRAFQVAVNGIFEQVTNAANNMSTAVVAFGALVAMVRQFIWDMVALLLAKAIEWGLIALAAAVPSFGASLASFAGWYTAQVASVCLKITSMISDLLGRARKAFKKCDKLVALIKKAEKKVKEISRQLKAMQKYAGRTHVKWDPNASGADSLPPRNPLYKSQRNDHVPDNRLPGSMEPMNRNGGRPAMQGPIGDPTWRNGKDLFNAAAPDPKTAAPKIAWEGYQGLTNPHRPTVPTLEE